MKELKKHIKDKKFNRIYLLYGDETYLKALYFDKLLNCVVEKSVQMMNVSIFEGKSFDINKAIADIETVPFMALNRVVVIKDSNLFDKGRKEDSEKIAEILNNSSESTIIIFDELKVDKRSKIYKSVSKNGYAAEFKTPDDNDLRRFIINYFKEKNKIITDKDAAYFVNITSENMQNMVNEADKLIDYLGLDNNVTLKEIELIVTKSLETKIFSLMDSIGNKNCKLALEIYRNLILMKEHPIMILSMMSRQFRMILQCKTLEYQKKSSSEIASELSLRPFVVNECIKQGKNFNKVILTNALLDCLETDVKIKTGKIEGILGVEILIIKYCS